MKRRPVEGEDKQVDSFPNYVFDRAQDRQFDLIETTITAPDIDERELKLQLVSGTLKLVTKVNGTLYRLTFS